MQIRNTSRGLTSEDVFWRTVSKNGKGKFFVEKEFNELRKKLGYT
jgi:hypothetical protein